MPANAGYADTLGAHEQLPAPHTPGVRLDTVALYLGCTVIAILLQPTPMLLILMKYHSIFSVLVVAGRTGVEFGLETACSYLLVASAQKRQRINVNTMSTACFNVANVHSVAGYLSR